MKKLISIFVLLFSCIIASHAQQSVQYTQFTFNDYGLNPAVAGASNGLEFVGGRRVQWRGFDGGPETNFVNVTKAFGKKGYRHFWHGIGAYIEQDKMGVYTTQVGYLSYAMHFKLSPKFRLSFGLAGGIKKVSLSNIVFDSFDPTFTEANRTVKVPDIIPGLYLYSKKFSLGVSMRNVFLNTLKFDKHQLGTGTGVLLVPTAYVTVSRKFVSGDYNFVSVPAINIQSDLRSIPSANLNFITYYKKRIGLGLNYRIHDAASVILQVRIFKNFVVGFAYDYTISRFHIAKANSDEIMMGFTPMMSVEDIQKLSTSDCPKFVF